MDKTLREILAKEFCIDEPRELTAEDRVLEAVENKEGEATGAPKISQSESNPEDLIQQISAMMREQERLNDLAEELRDRNSEPTADEFLEFFKKSLPVLDSLDRIIYIYEMQEEPSEELANWMKSVAAVRNRVTDLFGRFGLRAMDPVGKTVDLNRHEVVDVVHTDSILEETIVEVRQKGFVFNGKVLRDARVVVAKNDRSS